MGNINVPVSDRVQTGASGGYLSFIHSCDLQWLILIILFTICLHLSGLFGIGYISDDYDWLMRAASSSVCSFGGGHHFSPVIAGLFKLAANHLFPLVAWHLLVLFAHSVSICLVYIIARSALKIEKWPTLFATAFFAISSAGIEALAWKCAIGYVLITPCVLAAFLVAINVRKHILAASVFIAFLQLAGFLKGVLIWASLTYAAGWFGFVPLLFRFALQGN